MTPQSRRSEQALRALVTQAEQTLHGAVVGDPSEADAATIVAWVTRTFHGRIAVASAMANPALVHLVAQHEPGVDVLFCDTGYHFPETYATRDRVAAELDVNVVTLTPRQTVAEQDATYGSNLFARDPGLCCQLRKVEPLREHLANYEVWLSGVRRDESPTRARTPLVAWDARNGLVKVNPFAAWTAADVALYSNLHGLPVNPLLDDGYPSIGCAPCTQRVAPGDDPRSGRWAGTTKTECGLHT